MLIVWMQRTAYGHRLHLERLALPEPRDDDAWLQEVTANITARLEGAIRQAPEQWVWLHDRWKTQPRAREPAPILTAKN